MSLDRNSPAREVLGRLGLIGHPWHGLCRGGVLTLPNGTTKEYPQPVSGDAYVLRVPGIPEVVRSPEDAAADAAAGRAWLNYAMVSGSDYQIYSRPLGAGRWVYVDSAGDRWLVTTTLHGATLDTLTTGSTITVTLKRFGVIGGAPATHTYTVTVPDLGQATPTLYRPTSSGETVLSASLVRGRLFAIHPQGSRAVFQLAHEVDALLRNSQLRWRPCGWLEVQITGTGASAAVSLVVLKTRQETVGLSEATDSRTLYVLYQQVEQTFSYVGTAPFPTCGGTRVDESVTTATFEGELIDGTPDLVGGNVYLAVGWPSALGNFSMMRGPQQVTTEYVIGVGYDASGALEYFTARYTLDEEWEANQELVILSESRSEFEWVAVSASACGLGTQLSAVGRSYRVIHTDSSLAVLTISLRRNGVEFASHESGPLVTNRTVEFLGAGVEAYALAAPVATTQTYDGQTRDGFSGWRHFGFGGEWLDQRALLAMEAVARIGDSTGSGYLAWYWTAQPYSSSVYGIQERRRIGQVIQTLADLHKVGGSNVSTTGDTVYASRHPVTGAVAVDTVPVCWV